MTDWPAFAGITGVVLTVLLVLARISQAALDDTPPDGGDTREPGTRPGDERHPERIPDDATADSGRDRPPADAVYRPLDDPVRHPPADDQTTAPPAGPDRTGAGNGRDGEPGTPDVAPAMGGRQGAQDLSTGVLLANVAVSQGLLGTLLLAGAWYAAVPVAALGAGQAGVGPVAAAAGVGLGVALYVANEAGAAVGRHVGLGGSEELRAALAPETAGGWAVLLLVVLPVIAGFEELLFRGALVGAMSAGFDLSPWPLAVGSSVAFAAGHGAQGRVGMAVTGTLGFVLAAAFVLTGSLLTVVVAHYLVNALEFLVHEWAGIDPAERRWPSGD